MTNTTPKRRTITLTGKAPISIDQAAWPVIASAEAHAGGQPGTPAPPYECSDWRLVVRQHADGRALVYGVARAPNAGWPTHGASDWRGGELLAPDWDIPAAIQRVGADLEELGGAPASVTRECLADLPAEQI